MFNLNGSTITLERVRPFRSQTWLANPEQLFEEKVVHTDIMDLITSSQHDKDK